MAPRALSALVSSDAGRPPPQQQQQQPQQQQPSFHPVVPLAGFVLTTLTAVAPPLTRPRGGWSWFASRRLAQKEAAALSIPVASPVFGDLREYVPGPYEVNTDVVGLGDHAARSQPRGKAAAPARRSFRPATIVLDGQAADSGGGGVVGGELSGGARFLWAVVAFGATVLALPVAVLAFPGMILFTVVRSLRTHLLHPLGVQRWERAVFALDYMLFLLLLALVMVTIFDIGPNVAAFGTDSVSWAIGTLLIATAIPVWIFLFASNTHRYWNRVPGGLTRTTIRFTFANLRTIVALLFTAVQLAAFPISRLPELALDADLRFGNSTAPQIQGISTLSASELAVIYEDIEALCSYAYGLLPYVNLFIYLTWTCVVAVATWVAWLAVPVTQQLLLVWWIGALQRPGAVATAAAPIELAATDSGVVKDARGDDGDAGGPARDPDQAQDALNKAAQATGAVASAKARTRVSQLAFDLARGRYFTRYMYGQRLHGLVQYLLGDLFYVSITSNLLRSINCREVCVQAADGSGALTCVGTLLAYPTELCWVTTQHQLLASVSMLAFFVYIYTATFASPLMVDVLNKGDKLDIRTTPRFAVAERISELSILACYILIDSAIPVVPIVIHALICLVLTVYVERTRPGSDRTILLRSCLFQIGMWIPVAALTAYVRVPWLPLILMGGGVVLILLITLLRYLPMRRRLNAKDLRFAVQGLGSAQDDLDAEGLVRVRGLDQHMIEEGNSALASGDTGTAIASYKRAIFHVPTQTEAACCLATMSYEGRYMPRYLQSTLRICSVFLDRSRRATRLSKSRAQTLRTLRVLCQWELNLPLTERFADVLAWLDRLRRNGDPPHGRRPAAAGGDSIATANAWCLLGLMYERVGVVGVRGLVRREHRALRKLTRRELFDLAHSCMRRGANLPGGLVPTFHWARYAMDGIGCNRDPAHALELLAYLVQQGCRHAFWFTGTAWYFRVLNEAGLPNPTRELWHGWAYDAWRFGAVAGDAACQARCTQLPPRRTPLELSSLPRPGVGAPHRAATQSHRHDHRVRVAAARLDSDTSEALTIGPDASTAQILAPATTAAANDGDGDGDEGGDGDAASAQVANLAPDWSPPPLSAAAEDNEVRKDDDHVRTPRPTVEAVSDAITVTTDVPSDNAALVAVVDFSADVPDADVDLDKGGLADPTDGPSSSVSVDQGMELHSL